METPYGTAFAAHGGVPGCARFNVRQFSEFSEIHPPSVAHAHPATLSDGAASNGRAQNAHTAAATTTPTRDHLRVVPIVIEYTPENSCAGSG